MTNERAEELKAKVTNAYTGLRTTIYVNDEAGLLALIDKATPKAVVMDGAAQSIAWPICPICGNRNHHTAKYCNECGQAIRGSE